MNRRSLLSIVLGCLMGCAAPLGLSRPATVIEPGHYRVSADVGMRVSPGATDVQQVARRQMVASSGASCGNDDPAEVCADDAARRSFVEGAFAGVMSSPQTADAGIALRYGVRPGMDAGVRLGSSAVRGEVAWQLYGDPLNSVDSGLTALVGVGLSHQLEVARQPQSLVKVSDVGRNDLDLFALVGYRHYRRAYVSLGARYMASLLRADLVELVPDRTAPDGLAERALPDTDTSGLAHHIGLVISAYAGLGAAFLGLEIAGGMDFVSVRALGQDSTVMATSIRPSLVFFLEF